MSATSSRGRLSRPTAPLSEDDISALAAGHRCRRRRHDARNANPEPGRNDGHQPRRRRPGNRVANGEAADGSGRPKPLAPADKAAEAAAEKSGSGGWSLFKKKGRAPRRRPANCRRVPRNYRKDSREAAADILREMTRRR